MVVLQLQVIFDVVPVVMQRQVPTIQTVQKAVEVIQLVPHERIQERIAEQVVDIPLPQIMEEMMEVVLFIPRTRQNRTVEKIVDVSISPDSGGNFRVSVMRHAFHLGQILRAQATRSQVERSASQRAHREHAPNEVVGKVFVRSCRECHQKTAEHQFVDRQRSRVP